MSLVAKEELAVKNVLVPSVVDKYRLAGQITQTCLKYVLALIEHQRDKSIGEICRLGDDYLNTITNQVYRSVQERGVALPVQILKNEFVNGVAPEETDLFQGGYLNENDIVKVVLGVHIDGYTVQAAHTLVLRGEGEVSQAVLGKPADVICASYLATEAVVAFLSLAFTSEPVTGTRIRELVENIASSFDCQVLGGSKVRLIERFLAGQSSQSASDTIKEDITGIIWADKEPSTEAELEDRKSAEEAVVVTPGSAWLVDIQMINKTSAKIKRDVFTGHGSALSKASIYSRDYTVQYGLKVSASKHLLNKIGQDLSVYPFKLSYLGKDESDLKQARLGLHELVQHHILIPHEMERITTPDVFIAREMATVLLVPASDSSNASNEHIRLSGGDKVAAPSWVHSVYEIATPQILQLLNVAKDNTVPGVKFKQVNPMAVNPETFEVTSQKMEIDS